MTLCYSFLFCAVTSFFQRSSPKRSPRAVSCPNRNGEASAFNKVEDGNTMPFIGESRSIAQISLLQSHSNAFHCIIHSRPELIPFTSFFLQFMRFCEPPQPRTPHSSLSSSPRNRPSERTCRSRDGAQGPGRIPSAIQSQINNFLGTQNMGKTTTITTLLDHQMTNHQTGVSTCSPFSIRIL